VEGDRITVSGDPSALRISWSRIRLHDECPAKGQLMRDHKTPYKDIRSFFHGNVVDLLMRRWLDQEEPEPGWMLANVAVVFDEALGIARDTGDGYVKWKSATDRAEVLAFCTELVVRLEKILTVYALPFTWQPAVRFDVPVMVPDLRGDPREIRLVGEMDLLLTDNLQRTAIYDLKATKDDNYYQKVLGQLAFYAFAVRILTGSYPHSVGLIQPMCKQRVLPVEITETARREMAGRITRTAQDIWAGRTAPKKDDAGCSWCPVQGVCPKFRHIARRGRVSVGAGASVIRAE
jgi:hypothetical protein